MKENEILGNNEEHPEHYEVLSGLSLLISRSGKNRKTEVITRDNKYKKRPYVTRMCVLHKVVDFAIFLGSLRISIFTLLEEIENERVYPEIYNDLAKSLYTSLFSSSRTSVNRSYTAL